VFESLQSAQTHLQEDLELLRDLVGLALPRSFRAVAAHSQAKVLPTVFGDPLAQLARIVPENHAGAAGATKLREPAPRARREVFCSAVVVVPDGCSAPPYASSCVGVAHDANYLIHRVTAHYRQRGRCTSFSSGRRQESSAPHLWIGCPSRVITGRKLGDVDASAAEPVRRTDRKLRASRSMAAMRRRWSVISRPTSRMPPIASLPITTNPCCRQGGPQGKRPLIRLNRRVPSPQAVRGSRWFAACVRAPMWTCAGFIISIAADELANISTAAVVDSSCASRRPHPNNVRKYSRTGVHRGPQSTNTHPCESW